MTNNHWTNFNNSFDFECFDQSQLKSITDPPLQPPAVCNSRRGILQVTELHHDPGVGAEHQLHRQEGSAEDGLPEEIPATKMQ